MDRLVVESPVSNDVPIVGLDMLPDVSQFALLNPQGCPSSGEYLPPVSPVSSPGSPSSRASLAAGSLPDEAAVSHYSVIGSPSMLLSTTDHTANLHILTPPLIPRPDMVLLHADQALLHELTQTYHDFLPLQEPVPRSIHRPFLPGRAATRDPPLISTGRAGCPYRMTSYRDDDDSSIDSQFGVHVHHHRFLEWVGAPESARLLSRPSAEWLQVMNRRDTMHAALQLQRDASLMSSNLTVLHQYAIAVHRMSTEVLHGVFGREFFPSGAVNDAASVPRVFRALTHMAVMGLWRPPVGPEGPGLESPGPEVPVLCHPRPSGW